MTITLSYVERQTLRELLMDGRVREAAKDYYTAKSLINRLLTELSNTKPPPKSNEPHDD